MFETGSDTRFEAAKADIQGEIETRVKKSAMVDWARKRVRRATKKTMIYWPRDHGEAKKERRRPSVSALRSTPARWLLRPASAHRSMRL